MNPPNYRIKYNKNKHSKLWILIIIIILILLFVFKPLTWLRKTLAIKSMEYKSNHDPVYFSNLTVKNKKLPISGTITKSYLPDQKGINITPTSIPTQVRVVDIGMVTDIGYNDTEKNYIKIRHVSENNKDIYFTYYSNLPEPINLKINEWVGSSTILYSGNNLDYLHFEVLDFYGNNLDPAPYINIE